MHYHINVSAATIVAVSPKQSRLGPSTFKTFDEAQDVLMAVLWREYGFASSRMCSLGNQLRTVAQIKPPGA